MMARNLRLLGSAASLGKPFFHKSTRFKNLNPLVSGCCKQVPVSADDTSHFAGNGASQKLVVISINAYLLGH